MYNKQKKQIPSEAHRVVRIKVFNTSFNNISVISLLSVLLVEETEVPGENHNPTTRGNQILHNLFPVNKHCNVSGQMLNKAL